MGPATAEVKGGFSARTVRGSDVPVATGATQRDREHPRATGPKARALPFGGMTHHKLNGRAARFNPDEREKDRGGGESVAERRPPFQLSLE